MSNKEDTNTEPLMSENEALCEAVRVMFGFRDRDEVEDLFAKELMRRAIPNLESALEVVRARRQPDEFALALAVETQVLKEADAAGHDLESLFNDPDHHQPPSGEIAGLMERLWR